MLLLKVYNYESFMKLTVPSFIFLTLVLSACHNKDQKFCSCMDKSQEVNQLSEKIWQNEGNAQDSLRLKKLIASKNQLCEEYASKNGEELMALKADCQ